MYLNATTLHMGDVTVVGSEGPYKLNARGMLKTDDGYYIGVQGTGLLSNTPHVKAIIANETGVKPTKWGEIETLTTWTFKASGKYAALTQSTFVANIRLSPSDNSDTVAYTEFKLSRILPGPPSLCGSDSGEVFHSHLDGVTGGEL
jgi:hypothetical protein